MKKKKIVFKIVRRLLIMNYIQMTIIYKDIIDNNRKIIAELINY